MTIEITDPDRNVTGNYHWKVFWTVAIALFAMVMDFSIVFLALSSIADEFDVTLRAVTWVAIASSLTMSAFMLPLGRVSDITGRHAAWLRTRSTAPPGPGALSIPVNDGCASDLPLGPKVCVCVEVCFIYIYCSQGGETVAADSAPGEP